MQGTAGGATRVFFSIWCERIMLYLSASAWGITLRLRISRRGVSRTQRLSHAIFCFFRCAREGRDQLYGEMLAGPWVSWTTLNFSPSHHSNPGLGASMGKLNIVFPVQGADSSRSSSQSAWTAAAWSEGSHQASYTTASSGDSEDMYVSLRRSTYCRGIGGFLVVTSYNEKSLVLTL